MSDDSFDSIFPDDQPQDPLEMSANPGLYNMLKPPRADLGEAESSVDAFLREVSVLRVRHRIPEVLVLAAVHFVPDPAKPDDTVAIKGVAYGHPDYRAQLGALAFNTYTLPTIQQAEALQGLAMNQGKKEP